MSWGTCYDCNNICNEYPSLLEDGRAFTNYDFPTTANKELMERNGITTDLDYRKFLTNNAETIINTNKKEACDQVGICKYGPPLKIQNNGKYLYRSCQDMTQPFGYENSDLKKLYLSREDLHSRLSAPLMSQQEFLAIPKSN